MRIHKLTSVDAFIAIDLEDAPFSSGPVRLARRILQGGAKDLARSQTYTYAVLGMNYGGASAGISAPQEPTSKQPATRPNDNDGSIGVSGGEGGVVEDGRVEVGGGVGEGGVGSVSEGGIVEGREVEGGRIEGGRIEGGMDKGGVVGGGKGRKEGVGGAVGRFVEEVAELVGSGAYLPDAGKGVREVDLAPLRSADPRHTALLKGEANRPSFAERCEGLSAAVCAEKTLGELEGRTVAIEGFGASGPALAEAVSERGGRIVVTENIGDLGGAEVLFVGSKMGVLDHLVAAKLIDTKAVIPSGRLPITARALATLRRAGVMVVADFVALAGSTIALWGNPNRTEANIHNSIIETVGTLSEEFAQHQDGPFIAACLAAEKHLTTWQSEVPFGRPLAP